MPLDALQLMQGYRSRDLANMGAQQRMDIIPQELALKKQVAEQAQQRQKALADMQAQRMMQDVQKGRQLAAYQAATLKSRELDRASREKIETQKLAATKETASNKAANAAAFTPEALIFTARQYLTGDRQAALGFARSPTARVALQNSIVDEAAKMGLSPEQTAAKMAEFSGTVAGSRTVGQRAANISLAATEANEMIDIVRDSSSKFPRSQFVPFNTALRAYETGTGDPEIAAFGASVNALVNVYARAINPTGVPTVSDKEHARAVLNTVQSPEQVDAVLGIIRKELEIAKKAPTQVRESIKQSIAPSIAPPIAPPTASPTQWDDAKEKRYQELLKKRGAQ